MSEKDIPFSDINPPYHRFCITDNLMNINTCNNLDLIIIFARVHRASFPLILALPAMGAYKL